MKERPILFNAEMVRAVLALIKKQTRRIPNNLIGFGNITEFGPSDTEGYDWHFRDSRMRWHDISHEKLLQCCPYGKPGDRLWARETHAFNWLWFQERGMPIDTNESEVLYKADPVDCDIHSRREMKWRPSIYMPRWASRITLTITDVRVERVQDIRPGDAGKEGVDSTPAGPCQDGLIYDVRRDRFRALWNSINEKCGYGWDKNPWVWVVEFEVAK